jgi:hypothetical protein
MGSFGNAILDVPTKVQEMEHILAMQKMIAERLKVEAKDIAIINFIFIAPE